jgi:hypothetical protein
MMDPVVEPDQAANPTLKISVTKTEKTAITIGGVLLTDVDRCRNSYNFAR